MITYYPDGTWSTDEISSDEVAQIKRAIERLNDEPIERLFDLLVRDYINLAEADGSSDYVEDCDHDCEYCDYADSCDEYEEEDEEYEETTPTPAAYVDHVDVCKDCEFHVAGFPCSRTTKMKKGCKK